MTQSSTTLHRRHLDSSVAPLKGLVHKLSPRNGWIREIRQALGISSRQLADRLGIAPSGVSLIEKREQRGAVTLESLRNCADKLDCDLVYAFVPRRSLQDTLDTQVTAYATRLVGRVAETMTLEGQATSQEFVRRQIAETRQHIASKVPRDLWDKSDGG